MKKAFRFICLLLILCTGLASAQNKRKELTKDEVRDLVNGLAWKTGTVPIGNGRATLNLSQDYRFLGPEDTRKVMNDLWGNLNGSWMGMIFPKGTGPLNANWAVLVEDFKEEGFVKDEDADKLEPDKLLKQMQESQEESNKERVSQGLPELEILGWAMKPAYDKEAKKLTWAIDLRTKNSPKHSVNYFVRVLGRHGYLVLNLLGGADMLPEIQASLPQVLSMVNFNEGQRYADYNPKTDKVAAYGIAGLIAAGVGLKLAKLGIFALFLKKIGVIFAVAWKAILAACAVVASAFKKLFGRKNTESSPTHSETGA